MNAAEVVVGHWPNLTGSCTCGFPADTRPLHAAHLLNALKDAGYAVVKVPVVAFKAPRDSDASLLRSAAGKAEKCYPVGGSNVGHAVSQILLAVADAAEANA